MTTAPTAAFTQVAQRLDPGNKLLRTWPLTGGVSAQMTALEITQPDGQVIKVVVRQHGEADRAQNPNVAADEFRLLQFVQSVGLAVPTPLYVDQSTTIFPTPYLVIEYIDGQPIVTATNTVALTRQMADYLAHLHHVDGSTHALAFLAHQTARYTAKLRPRPTHLDVSLHEDTMRDVLEAVWPLPQHNPTVLLHGDFWPGNMLWRDDHLVAVVDWEDAAVGDPLADLAISRLDLLWAFGEDAMHQFTAHYATRTTVDLTNLPYWDLCAALRPAFQIATWAGDPVTEQRMRDRHRWFVSQAMALIGASLPGVA